MSRGNALSSSERAELQRRLNNFRAVRDNRISRRGTARERRELLIGERAKLLTEINNLRVLERSYEHISLGQTMWRGGRHNVINANLRQGGRAITTELARHERNCDRITTQINNTNDFIDDLSGDITRFNREISSLQNRLAPSRTWR